MKEETIDCRVTYYEDGSVAIKSGLPVDEIVIEGVSGKSRRGVMCYAQNGDGNFSPAKVRPQLPPQVETLVNEGQLLIRKTSRHLIVSYKFDIIESVEETRESHKKMWRKALKAIKKERERIKREEF